MPTVKDVVWFSCDQLHNHMQEKLPLTDYILI